MSSTTKMQWAPCLLLESQPTACGITSSYPERLPGLYDTSTRAITAAVEVMHQHPSAIGVSAKRVEVHQ